MSGQVSPGPNRGVALALSFVAHVALVFWLAETTMSGALTPLPSQQVVAAELVRLPPPPAPPVVEPQKAVKQYVAKRAPVEPTPQPEKSADSVRPQHTFASRNDDWGAPVAGGTSGKGARRVPSDYAEKVKSRVVAGLVRPADAVFKAPRGFKGDPRVLQRQCTIPYEITVDRQGNMISYRIEPCGDAALDAAAEAALQRSGPFPPPPGADAEEYVIYGSANFRTNLSQ